MIRVEEFTNARYVQGFVEATDPEDERLFALSELLLNLKAQSPEDFREILLKDLLKKLNSVRGIVKMPLPFLLMAAFEEWMYPLSGYYLEHQSLINIEPRAKDQELYITRGSNLTLPEKYYELAQETTLVAMRKFGLRDDNYVDEQPEVVERYGGLKRALSVRRYPSQTISRLEFKRSIYSNLSSGEITNLYWEAQQVKRPVKLFWLINVKV